MKRKDGMSWRMGGGLSPSGRALWPLLLGVCIFVVKSQWGGEPGFKAHF